MKYVEPEDHTSLTDYRLILYLMIHITLRHLEINDLAIHWKTDSSILVEKLRLLTDLCHLGLAGMIADRKNIELVKPTP